jgi:hypothetical protein
MSKPIVPFYFSRKAAEELRSLLWIANQTSVLIEDFAKDDIDISNLRQVHNAYVELLAKIIEEYAPSAERPERRYAGDIKPRKRRSDDEFEFLGPGPREEKPPPPPEITYPFERVFFAADLLTCKGNWRSLLEKIAAEEFSGVHIFGIYAWDDNVASPWLRIGEWPTDYEDAPMLPFYDLTQFDENYWQRLEKILRYMKELGLKAFISLDDYTSLKRPGWLKYWHPVLSSWPDRDMKDPEVNRIPGGYWTMDGSGIQAYFRPYIERMVRLLQEIGIEFYIERMNEYDALDWPTDYTVQWHYYEVKYLKSLGVPRDHIFTSGGRDPDAMLDQVAIFSWHGIVRPERLKEITTPTERTLVSGDGGGDGSGRISADGYRGLGVAEAIPLGEEIVNRGFWGYEFMDQGMYGKDANRMDADDVDFTPWRAFLFGARRALGIEIPKGR